MSVLNRGLWVHEYGSRVTHQVRRVSYIVSAGDESLITLCGRQMWSANLVAPGDTPRCKSCVRVEESL